MLTDCSVSSCRQKDFTRADTKTFKHLLIWNLKRLRGEHGTQLFHKIRVCMKENAKPSFTESYKKRVRWSFRSRPPRHSREPGNLAFSGLRRWVQISPHQVPRGGACNPTRRAL